MLLLAALASATNPSRQAEATVRIVRAQRVTLEEWQRSKRRREIVVSEAGRKVTVRLIDFE